MPGGHKRPKDPDKTNLTTWVSKETLARFQKAAERERRPASNLLWHILELWLEEHHPDLKEMKE